MSDWTLGKADRIEIQWAGGLTEPSDEQKFHAFQWVLARARELEGRLAGIAAAVEAWEAAGMVVVAVASVRGILDEVGEAKPSTSRTAETRRPKSE